MSDDTEEVDDVLRERSAGGPDLFAMVGAFFVAFTVVDALLNGNRPGLAVLATLTALALGTLVAEKRSDPLLAWVLMAIAIAAGVVIPYARSLTG